MTAQDGGDVAAYLAEHSAACPDCGLQLKGCTQPACPSCGRRLTVGELARAAAPVDKSPVVTAYGCPECGYALSGLPTDVCPECGCDMTIERVQFEPAPARTERSSGRLKRLLTAAVGTFLTAGFIGAMSAVVGHAMVGRFTEMVALVSLGITAASCIIVALLLCRAPSKTKK